MEKQNTNLILLSIVAVVAIVGIIIMITGTVDNLQQGMDSAGWAEKAATTTTDNTQEIVSANMLCRDTDNGKNKYVKGTTTSGTISKTDFCRNFNSSILIEHYCDNGRIMTMPDILCEYGCSDGACKAGPELRLTTRSNEQQRNNNTNNTNSVLCPAFLSDGNIDLACSRNCPNSSVDCRYNYTYTYRYTYEYGACENNILEPGEQCMAGQTMSCSELDPNTFVNGTVTCTGCNWNNSQCTPKVTCTNTDGGMNKYVKGAVNGFSIRKTEYNMIDSCSSDGKKLIEFYCEGNIPKNMTITCNCSNGACIQNQTNQTGSLYVVSNPSLAQIYVDDIYKGVTPITIVGLNPGSHIVKLMKENQYEYTTIKEIYWGQTTNLNLVTDK